VSEWLVYRQTGRQELVASPWWGSGRRLITGLHLSSSLPRDASLASPHREQKEGGGEIISYGLCEGAAVTV
jgi:hypothetical protein